MDEDEELRRAIEESKRTAEKEELARIKNEAQEKIKPKEKKPAADADEFDFGAGFEKFATGQQKIDADNNLDGFDFGGSDNK